MKIAPFLALLLFPLIVSGRDTAYQALRTVGDERDKALLHRVLEVKGRNGTPQPQRWTIVLDDPLARGGVREIEVAGGHIVSERTPVRSYSGSVEGLIINFQRLNLDSSSVFTIVEEQAKAAKVGFDSADYVLCCNEANGAPVWTVQLLDLNGRALGTVSLAADTGAVIAKDFGKARTGSPSPAPKKEARRQSVRSDSFTSSQDDARADGVGYQVDRAIHQAGAGVEEFFTGRRTLDRNYRDDEDR